MMIAVASMTNKPLIIVDEPTSALDSGSTERVLAFLRHQTRKGTSVLAVSHDMGFAKGCDRHIIM
jgi:putative ABC transport system ATP-binding protein